MLVIIKKFTDNRVSHSGGAGGGGGGAGVIGGTPQVVPNLASKKQI